MTFPVPLAAMSGDAVIGIAAVIIWIWLSVMGKRGKPNRPPAPPADGSGEPHDPQAELRKFFETLEKGLNMPSEDAAPPAPPPAPPPARTTTPPPIPRHAPKPPPVRAVVLPEPPAVVAPPPLAAAAPQESMPELKPTRAAEASPLHPAGSLIRDALRSREGLRHAIVAAEILGPPVSMRKFSPDTGHR